jgi:hypothetical protein
VSARQTASTVVARRYGHFAVRPIEVWWTGAGQSTVKEVVASTSVQTDGRVAHGYGRLALGSCPTGRARAVEPRATSGPGVFGVCAIDGVVEARVVHARHRGCAIVADDHVLAVLSVPTRRARARRRVVEVVVACPAVEAISGVARGQGVLALNTGPTRGARAIETRTTSHARVCGVGARRGTVEARRVRAGERSRTVVALDGLVAPVTGPTGQTDTRHAVVQAAVASAVV